VWAETVLVCVLIMSVCAIVPEKSRENKKCDEEEDVRDVFGRFGIRYDSIRDAILTCARKLT